MSEQLDIARYKGEHFYSSREAADYLGMTEQGIRYHLRKRNLKETMKIAGTLVFAEDDLKRFQEQQRLRHPPSLTPQPN